MANKEPEHARGKRSSDRDVTQPPTADRERRTHQRREADTNAAADAPIVHRLLNTGRVASAFAAIGVVLGGAIGAGGVRFVGPKQDADAIRAEVQRVDTSLSARLRRTDARLDSMVYTLRDMQANQEMSSFIQCVQMRMALPALRPKGCDAIEARGRKP